MMTVLEDTNVDIERIARESGYYHLLAIKFKQDHPERDRDNFVNDTIDNFIHKQTNFALSYRDAKYPSKWFGIELTGLSDEDVRAKVVNVSRILMMAMTDGFQVEGKVFKKDMALVEHNYAYGTESKFNLAKMVVGLPSDDYEPAVS